MIIAPARSWLFLKSIASSILLNPEIFTLFIGSSKYTPFLIITLKTSGYFDVKKWVLSLGSQVEVLEPKRMRDDLKKELEESLLKYS